MAQELLFELRRRGVRLRLVDGHLEVHAPSGSLTTDLREQLRERRDELIGLLRRGEAGAAIPEIVPNPQGRYQPFPLTDIQHAYWVGRASAVELGGVASHFYFERERDGLDHTRLQRSLRKVIDRHDMLRAVILPDGRQRILPQVPPYEIAVYDLAWLPPRARDGELARIRSEMDHQVLPSDRWPLFDIRASRLDEERIRLHMGFDVLILDALSLYLLFEEWRRFYEDLDWSPAPLSVSYRDYVLSLRDTRKSTTYKNAEEYWLDRVESLPPPPSLPLAVQPGQLTPPAFTRREARVPREQWLAIKRMERRRGLTPSAVLMTAFADVLRLWSAQPDFTLNVTLFNRPRAHPEIDQIIGDFTTLTMLEARAHPDLSFAARAERLQRQLMRDLEHLSYNGVQLLRERGRRLGGGPSAAMPVVFTSALVLNADEAADQPSHIRFFGEQVYGITQTPQVWLDHQVHEDQGDLVFTWDAVEELFPRGLLDDMFSAYRDCLDRLSDTENAWDTTGSLASLPESQAAVRQEANDTTTDIPRVTLGALVEAQARLRPSAMAVVTGGHSLTYGELTGLSHRLARHLAQLGATRDALVAVVLDKGWEQVVAVLGINQAGAAYLPIDPQWPEARRTHLLAHGDVRIVVTTEELRDSLSWPHGIALVTLDDPAVASAGEELPATAPAADDLAYVIYTSGSTGQPKGVAIDNAAAANTICDINRRFHVGPDDAVLAVSALSFDLSVYDIFGLLAAGGTIVMPDPARAADPLHWNELVERHGVTIWNSVPALMQTWTDARARAAERPATKLRLALLSGDWIPVTLPDEIRSLHRGAEVISLGGATEASIWSVIYPIDEVPPEWTRIPYGKPLANQTMHVYGSQLEPCPIWVAGEVYIGGRGVARGYWEDPERTDERFIVHPETKERLYRTGDLGRYLPDGNIEFLGREDHQVKIHGHRIELGEIAAALHRQPGVREAIVGVDTEPKSGHRQLVAHVLPEAATVADAVPDEATWDAITEAGEAELRRGEAELGADLRGFQTLSEVLEDLSLEVMEGVFAELGVFTTAGESATATQIVERHRLKPLYAGLIGRWMSALAANGVLRPGDRPGEYHSQRPIVDRAAGDRMRELTRLDAPDSHRAIIDYFLACAENQLPMLRGETSPLQFLLPGGDWTVAEALYAGNPISRLANRVAARVILSLATGRAHNRPVRILEVGAGTGSTTDFVLSDLPADRVRYLFTDVSTYFTERAKRRFADHPALDFALYDIDREPAAQGVTPGSKDVILGANVIHDAKDLRRALTHLRSALAAGGLLVLVEGTHNALQHLVTVGLIEGLAQQNPELRPPLLSSRQWTSCLEATGFTRIEVFPGTGDMANVNGQHVIVAEAGGSTPRLDPEGLRDALEHLLPGYMVPRHIVPIDRVPLTANGKINRSELPSPWQGTAREERIGPQEQIEQRLFEIWRNTLGHDEFGVTDDFFELGGDSLHAVAILAVLREEFGLRVSGDEGLELLFDHPTITALAGVLRRQGGG